MKEKITPLEEALFEEIKHVDKNGEHWFARELMPLLGYGSKWQNFAESIKRAIESCKNAGNDYHKHFLLMSVKNEGKGRPREDYKLTRYACYLIAQNGDASKPEIALAQTYFAIQTRKQELAEENRLSQERKELRRSTADKYKLMSEALHESRKLQGKTTEQKHYVNEARLINQIALGKNTKGLQELAGTKDFRDLLSKESLFNLNVAESGNTWFLMQGLDYQERKSILNEGKASLKQIDDKDVFQKILQDPSLEQKRFEKALNKAAKPDQQDHKKEA